jgi:hypothetical protein
MHLHRLTSPAAVLAASLLATASFAQTQAAQKPKVPQKPQEAQASGPQTPLSMPVGGEGKLRLKGLQRVAVGDPAVADARIVEEDQLLIIGASVGQTTMLAWTLGASAPQSFAVTVTAAQEPDPAPAPPPLPVFLGLGEKMTRAVPGMTRAAIGDPEIVGLTPTSDRLVLEGLKAGTTTVLVWLGGRRETWQVTVAK